ncbi:M3 family metallopeptidase, partial [uncultured Duncaniella sp.]
KWAEVLDADAFAHFKENGIFDRKTAESFRQNILSRGGTENPDELYRRFRGKDASIDALLQRDGISQKPSGKLPVPMDK